MVIIHPDPSGSARGVLGLITYPNLERRGVLHFSQLSHFPNHSCPSRACPVPPSAPVPHTHTMLPLCANYSSSCASSFPLLGIEPMAFPWVDKPSTALLPSDLPNIPLLDVSIFFNLFFKNFGNVCNVFIDPPQSLSTLQGQPHPPHSFPYSMCVSHLELKTSHSLPFDQF